jgi:hypothetical protein
MREGMDIRKRFQNINCYILLTCGIYVRPTKAGRFVTRVRISMRSLDFFTLTNPSSRTMALGFTQPITEMSIRNRPEGKARPARKAHNLTAICERTV